MASQIAIVGLGNMGRGLASNIVRKGNLTAPLVVFNRTTKRSDDLRTKLGAENVTVALSVEEAVASADIILFSLGDDDAVLEIITRALKEEVQGKVFVDCSTVHPTTTVELTERINARGADFVAMPVFGAPMMADAGQLICVLAGPKAAVERVKPFTTGVIGRMNIDLSDQKQSQASLLKVIGNTFILDMVNTLSEGLTVAETSGLGVNNLHQLIEAMLPGQYASFSRRMCTGDYYRREEPLFAVDLARKDVGHALSLARYSGAKMKNLEVADVHLAMVKEHMGTRGDISGIYGAVRQASGLKFENS